MNGRQNSGALTPKIYGVMAPMNSGVMEPTFIVVTVVHIYVTIMCLNLTVHIFFERLIAYHIVKAETH